MQITEEFLTNLGFSLSWRCDHGYRSQFTKYFDNVERSISLISVKPLGIEDEYTKFDVWFWGKDPEKGYCELDSHLQISTTEELEFLLSLLRNE